MTQKDVEDMFARYGRIINSRVLVDQASGRTTQTHTLEPGLAVFVCLSAEPVLFVSVPRPVSGGGVHPV